MAKKASQPPRLAPLQRVVAEPITDPAEQAALDKVRKQQKRNQRGRQPARKDGPQHRKIVRGKVNKK